MGLAGFPVIGFCLSGQEVVVSVFLLDGKEIGLWLWLMGGVISPLSLILDSALKRNVDEFHKCFIHNL